MNALALYAQAPIEQKPLKAVKLPVPHPGPREILIKIAACRVCRTDLHIIEGDLPLKISPIIPGRQMVGRVGAMGKERGRRNQSAATHLPFSSIKGQ